LLLDRDAHLDIESNLGMTALIEACYNRRVECARLLLERGAKMSITAKDFVIEMWI
jgi:ankyrin repeat protein